ncbi:hypothetical protein D3C73_760090 [compost metagenome]
MLSVILMLAGTLLTVIAGLPERVNVAITVSSPSSSASARTGILIVPEVWPAGMVMVLVTMAL